MLQILQRSYLERLQLNICALLAAIITSTKDIDTSLVETCISQPSSDIGSNKNLLYNANGCQSHFAHNHVVAVGVVVVVVDSLGNGGQNMAATETIV